MKQDKKWLIDFFGSFKNEWDRLLQNSFMEFSDMTHWFSSSYQVEMGERDAQIRIPVPNSIPAEQIYYKMVGNHLLVGWEDRRESRMEDERNYRFLITKQIGKAEHLIPLPRGVKKEIKEVRLGKGELIITLPKK